jgi:hypothetical protein
MRGESTEMAYSKPPEPLGARIARRLCRNTRCANPAHLAVVTGTENIRRGSSPAMVIARSGKCAQGHPRDPQNVRQRADGHLRCVPCSRQYAARRRRERKAA